MKRKAASGSNSSSSSSSNFSAKASTATAATARGASAVEEAAAGSTTTTTRTAAAAATAAKKSKLDTTTASTTTSITTTTTTTTTSSRGGSSKKLDLLKKALLKTKSRDQAPKLPRPSPASTASSATTAPTRANLPKTTTTKTTASPAHRQQQQPASRLKRTDAQQPQGEVPTTTAATSAAAGMAQLTPLQEKMRKALAGGRFRMINEALYTRPSKEAVKMFAEEPETFEIYHQGFRAQVESWPSNPVDHYIQTLGNTPPTTSTGPLTIADLGCGEAALAAALHACNTPERERFRVHSFDLASPNERVVACDIRRVPLGDAKVDVAVFCLSLMGTNFLEFLVEAWRILKMGGQLKIAEVVSRFSDLDRFIKAVERIGFKFVAKDTRNKMFVLFEFTKSTRIMALLNEVLESTAAEKVPLLKPCIYKRR
ncbi:methyltransferase-domain-containing protein [Zopfochytrium polystomum]|nr:methyltransferase-domain-containing protein [Zopfochytrium polystomum]